MAAGRPPRPRPAPAPVSETGGGPGAVGPPDPPQLKGIGADWDGLLPPEQLKFDLRAHSCNGIGVSICRCIRISSSLNFSRICLRVGGWIQNNNPLEPISKRFPATLWRDLRQFGQAEVADPGLRSGAGIAFWSAIHRSCSVLSGVRFAKVVFFTL